MLHNLKRLITLQYVGVGVTFAKARLPVCVVKCDIHMLMVLYNVLSLVYC